MGYYVFDPLASGGVTRDPWMDAKQGHFAVNFDKLLFKCNGEVVPTSDVISALPHMKTLLVIDRNQEDMPVINRSGRLVPKAMTGDIEIIGECLRCNCSLSEYMVDGYWEIKLERDNDTIAQGSGAMTWLNRT